jgi:3-hydroxymyristoyl/3-hydroxydecanoyl-(acyl carrier protein) dehydratase
MGDIQTLQIPPQHPAFEGHFPGAPLLPGVVLLDEMLQVLGATPAQGWTIATAKFLHPVRPGETLTFEHERLVSGGVRFIIRSADRPVASGMLVPRAGTPETDHGDQAL